MAEFGEVGYLQIFGIAFMLGGAIYFFYRLLVRMGGWLPFLTAPQVKGASTVIAAVTVTIGASVWFFQTDLLTCDWAAHGLGALRQDGALPKAAAGDVERYCTYYRDHCLDIGLGSNSANWAYCLQQRAVSPPV